MSKFSELPKRLKHAWLYFAGFLFLGFVLFPVQTDATTMPALLAGVCFGIAAMIGMFMLGKKAASEVE